ncbi:MAG: hypothetical protein ACPLX8_00985 [Nanopusillaceae archaeon]
MNSSFYYIPNVSDDFLKRPEVIGKFLSEAGNTTYLNLCPPKIELYPNESLINITNKLVAYLSNASKCVASHIENITLKHNVFQDQYLICLNAGGTTSGVSNLEPYYIFTLAITPIIEPEYDTGNPLSSNIYMFGIIYDQNKYNLSCEVMSGKISLSLCKIEK